MARLEIPIKVDIYKIEELIDQLKHLQTYKLFAGDEKTLVDRDEVVEIIADHVKAEVSPPEQQWIPCSERLPEDEQPILFSTTTGRVHQGRFHMDNSINRWYSSLDKMRAYNNVVNAWMPLPAPYHPEGDDKHEG